MCIWNTETGELTDKLTFRETPSDIMFSPDDTLLVIATTRVEFWDVKTKEIVRVIDDARIRGGPMAFSKDGKYLATVFHGLDRQSAIGIWQTGSGKLVANVPSTGSSVNGLAFCRQGISVCYGCGDGCIRVFDMQNSKVTLLVKRPLPINCMAISHDNEMLAFEESKGSGREKCRIILFDLKNEKLLDGSPAPFDSTICALRFSPDGKLLAYAGGYGAIGLWSVAEQKQLSPLNGHTGDVLQVRFLDNGRQLLSSAADGSIRLWSVETGRQLSLLGGQSSFRNSIVAIGLDHKTGFSAGWDSSLRFWDLTTGLETKRIDRPQVIGGASWAP